MIFLGIDPGKSGGVAVLDSSGELRTTFKLECQGVAISNLKFYSDGDERCVAVCEKVNAKPARNPDGTPRRVGTTSMFTFAGFYYGPLWACQAFGISVELVSPQRWQSVMGCLTGGDKKISKTAAERMFPGYKVTNWNADALLLAEYCRRTRGMKEPVPA